MPMRTKHSVLLGTVMSALFLASCAKGPSQNQYLADEVGVSRVVQFATVIQSRPVDITGKNSGLGTLGGAAVGGGSAAYIGQGSGSAWAMAGGAIAGAIAGNAIEQHAADHQGIEYILTKENGKTLSIVQELAKDERIFANGERVMIQTSGSYQRVLPAQQLPTSIARPKKIEVIDEPPPATLPNGRSMH
jgi:outer membrane lipoprotein SlyB